MGPEARRAQRGRRREMHQRTIHRPPRLFAARRGCANAGARGRASGACQRRGGAPMSVQLPVRKAILERRTYEPPGEGRANKLRLDFNENTAGCSRAATRALAKLSPKQLAMYPEYDRPTQRLARHFRVRPEELLLTNGGDDALRVFFDAFVDSGSSILICEPTFPMYRYYGEIAGARIDVLRYGAEMEFPLKGVVAALTSKPRVLFVANPNNPTGTLLQLDAIEAIAKTANHPTVLMHT